jgi:hypothetical protein
MRAPLYANGWLRAGRRGSPRFGRGTEDSWRDCLGRKVDLDGRVDAVRAPLCANGWLRAGRRGSLWFGRGTEDSWRGCPGKKGEVDDRVIEVKTPHEAYIWTVQDLLLPQDA